MQEHSYTLGSYKEAKKIREKLFQLQEQKKNPEIVIGGAGFTSIEFAGEICEFVEEFHQ